MWGTAERIEQLTAQVAATERVCAELRAQLAAERATVHGHEKLALTYQRLLSDAQAHIRELTSALATVAAAKAPAPSAALTDDDGALPGEVLDAITEFAQGNAAVARHLTEYANREYRVLRRRAAGQAVDPEVILGLAARIRDGQPVAGGL